MNNFAEQQTEWIISNNLINNGWVIDETIEKNVYFQKARPEHQSKLEIISKKRGYKKPDYILYHKTKPIGIIEAKAGGKPLKDALIQATEYAEMLEAPLIFASNGAYIETSHLFKNSNKSLFINGDEVNRLITYSEAIKFIEEGENSIYTVPKEIIKSKEELIKIFKKVNDLLRKANIFSGYDRISEFSNILFLKLISEKDGEKSWWNLIKKQDDDLLFKTLNGTIIKELENTYGGDVFSATNIEKPALFRQIMDMIDPLALSTITTDIKGDAFEYFLKNMNQADNDLGQYFTPRHIVEAMVHLVNPKFKETVCDPFCGTGGFLIESFNHIKGNSIIETEEDKKILTEQTLFGRDSTKVSTIAKKNMILHGDGHSNIEKLDSLENVVDGKYNCIITNIPFSLKDVDYSHLYYNSIAKKNGDAICVLHCLKALKEGGRMAVVVPEGFLFKKELKDVRKFLLSKANLELIVSLPQGVFQPYTGVKTDILYFTNAHKPVKQDGYLYFEVKNDGYSLDAHRRKISGKNDIHTLEEANLKRTEKELLLANGFEFIPFEKIKQADYNFVGARYREITRTAGKWEMVNLEDLLVNVQSKTIKIKKQECEASGSRPVISQECGYNIGYSSLNNGFITRVDLPLIIFGDHSLEVKYIDEEFFIGADGVKLLKPDAQKCLPKYLYYILKDDSFAAFIKNSMSGEFYSRHWSYAKQFTFPLPPLTEQQKLVDQLDNIQKSIKSAQDLIESLKSEGGGISLLFGSEEFEWKKLGEMADICRGGSPRPIEKYITNDENGLNWLKIGDVNSYEKYITATSSRIRKEGLSRTRLAQKGSFILSNSMSFGRPYILQIDTCVHDGWLIIENIGDALLVDFLYYVIMSDDVQNQFRNMAMGSTVKNLNIQIVKSINIPIPSIEIQQQIVDEMDAKNEYIKLTEQIIKERKQKMSHIIASIWNI